MNASAASQRTILWIDGCGGFGLLRERNLRVGREGCDINVLGDLSRHAGNLIRNGEEWGWREADGNLGDPNQVTWWLPTPGKLPLKRIGVELHRPHPLSSTRVLTVAPPHRLADSLDGMLLVGSVIVVGPTADCHCVVRHADAPIALSVTDDGIRFRHAGENYELHDDQPVRAGWLTIRKQTVHPTPSP